MFRKAQCSIQVSNREEKKVTFCCASSNKRGCLIWEHGDMVLSMLKMRKRDKHWSIITSFSCPKYVYRRSSTNLVVKPGAYKAPSSALQEEN